MTAAKTHLKNFYPEPLVGDLVGSPYAALFAASTAAKSVNSHLDFFNWLQREVHEFIPHDALLVAWGDFERCELNYDAASSLPGINTRSVRNVPGLDEMLAGFFRQTLKNDRGWSLLHEIDRAAIFGANEVGFGLDETEALNMKSVLVYALSDKRDNHDCLYLFFSQNDVIEVDPLVLDFLMPQVDTALRGVECLPVHSGPCKSRDCDCALVDSLSEREREVLHWVGMGKSNEEIGAILNISHNTVKNHLKRVFSKMGVSARSQAVQVYSKLNGHASSATL